MKKIIVTILIILSSFLIVACDDSDTKQQQDGETMIYYINNQDTKVVSQKYIPSGQSVEELVGEYIEKLKSAPSDITYKKTIPDSVNAPDWELVKEQRVLRLYFDSTYSQLKGVQELLRRAAVVKTLCQIPDVEFVEFYVSEQPLLDSDGGNVGPMKGTNFIDSTSKEFNYVEDQSIVLYYANSDGTKLVEKDATLRYDGTIALEKLIINQLISGPVENLNWNVYPTLSDATELISVSTYNNICYIEFNEAFLKKPDDVSDEVALYSVVNSLVDSLASVNKVQISVKGQVLKTYGKLTNLPQYLEHNYELTVTE